MRDFNDFRKDKPIVLTPMQYDLDSACHLLPVDTPRVIIDDAVSVKLLLGRLDCAPWKERLSNQLQSISEDLAGQSLLSTWMPLVELRYQFCSCGLTLVNKETRALMTRIFTDTRHWRELGVDTVDITGYLKIQ